MAASRIPQAVRRVVELVASDGAAVLRSERLAGSLLARASTLDRPVWWLNLAKGLSKSDVAVQEMA